MKLMSKLVLYILVKNGTNTNRKRTDGFLLTFFHPYETMGIVNIAEPQVNRY